MTIRKIVLIAPPSDAGQRKDALIPSGLLSIAGVLRENQYNVKVLNAGFFIKDKLEYIRENISGYAPDVIGIGFPTDAYESAKKIAQLAKEFFPNMKIIAGGIHPTAMPAETLTSPYFDYLVRGEGEMTTLELINALRDSKSVSQVAGVWHRENGKIITNPSRPVIADLDTIPFNYLDLLIDLNKYPKEALGQIHSSRGCVYNCAYCSSQIIWGNAVRFRSAENVLAQIDYLYDKYKVRDINFADDNFTLEPKRIRAICTGMIANKEKISWRCCSRADIHKRFDIELLKLMKRSGCKNICIGFESGSQKILDRSERDLEINQVETLVKMVKSAGIKIHADFIIGLPGENERTLNQTLELMGKIWHSVRPTMSVAIFKSYPGTLTYQRNENSDLKGQTLQIKEIFNYAEMCNIKNLSRNPKYIIQRMSGTITKPKELPSLFKKVMKTWINKNA
jgi:radical SAM superfamily enzyme YgiQ (UPF0313 family)